jgi:ABC-type dipeptide/oligopeptide/nickel transport system permease component
VLAFIVRRLVWSLPLLLGIMLATFALMRGAGGSPFRLETGGVPQSLELQFRDYYNLDEAWFVEFLTYVRNVATLDFGPSLTDRYVTVDAVVEEQFPVTVELALLATAWAVPTGIALGLVGGLRRRSALDLASTALATGLLVIPVFLFAEAASTYLVEDWGLFPSGWDSRASKVLPVIVLGLAPAGYVARLIRAAVVETLQDDYVRTARAKGLRSERIVLAHVLRNSLVPFLGAAVPVLALLVTGSFFVESAFDVPGAAPTFVSAAKQRDYPMVMGLTVVLAAVVILANLLADVAAAALDPRVREGRS